MYPWQEILRLPSTKYLSSHRQSSTLQDLYYLSITIASLWWCLRHELLLKKKCIPRLIQSLHSIPFVRWCFRHDLLLQKCLPICGPTISFLSVRTNDEHLFPLSTPLLVNSFLCYFVLSSVHSFIQYLTQSNSFCLQRRSVLFRNMVWCGDGQEQSDEK